MAPRRLVARRNSFIEVTSDEESITESEGSADVRASSSAPRKRSRRLAHQGPSVSSPPRIRDRARRNTQQRSQVTYKEDTTDEEEFVQPLENAHDQAGPSRPKRQRISAPKETKLPSRPPRRLQPGAVRKDRTEITATSNAQWTYRRNDSAMERRPPFFETLPFQIWTDIFEYASYPLFNPSKPQNAENRRWLARACTTCKTLLDPAVTALYRAPPISNVYAPHEVFDLLMMAKDERQTSKLGFDLNYNGKVQRLEFDANTLAYTAHGRGRFDLSKLIPVMPQLHSIRISSVYDLPDNKKWHKSTKWDYPDSLFAALNEHKRRLRSFEWHQSLCSKEQDLAWLESVHLTDAFQSLITLKLSGFEAKEPKKKNTVIPREQVMEQRLADTLAVLPNLRSLEFESCTVLNEILLPLLPQSLRVLHINDCMFFDSAMLGHFLSAHGSQLEQLILEHNKSLDIRFLPALKSSCPKLEILKIDLNYYNSHRTYLDSGPKYHDLLAEDDVPSWPSSLQRIELLHLRNWTDGAARTFFKSLADSADQLPDLRTLVVKAILSLGWRERKAFRNEWVPKLERIFLRKAKSPDRHFTSIAEGSAWLARLRQDPSLDKADAVVLIPVYKKLPTPPSEEEESSSSKRPRLRPRRRRANYSESSDEEGDDVASAPAPPASREVSSLAAAAKEALEKHIQGMCDVVDVTIDNLRPAEKQWGENDFLDQEPSDDEEWDPNVEDTGELYDGWAA